MKILKSGKDLVPTTFKCKCYYCDSEFVADKEDLLDVFKSTANNKMQYGIECPVCKKRAYFLKSSRIVEKWNNFYTNERFLYLMGNENHKFDNKWYKNSPLEERGLGQR